MATLMISKPSAFDYQRLAATYSLTLPAEEERVLSVLIQKVCFQRQTPLYVYVLYLNLYVVYTVSFMSCSSAHIWTLCYSSRVKKKSMYHFICISYFPVFWCEWRVNRSYCEQLFCAYALFQMALASVKQNDKWNNVVMFCVEDLPEKI